MKNDMDLIDDAYEDNIKALFKTFLTNIIGAKAAKDPKAAAVEAEHAFQNGVRLAKSTRDRAKQLLGPGLVA